MHRLLLCCRRRPPADMGAALSQPQEGAACGPQSAPTTMAEVIRERKKKAGGAGLATLRRRLAAAAARRPRSDARSDRGCRGGEHARWVRQLVSGWRPAEVAALHEEYEAAAALRDLITQAELAREPAPTLQADLAHLYADRWCGDAELVYRGSVFTVHRAVLSARCPYFRDLLNSYPNAGARICLEGMPAHLTAEDLDWVLRAVYAGDEPPPPECCAEGEGGGWCSCPSTRPACVPCSKSSVSAGGADCCSRAHLDIVATDRNSGWRGGGGCGASWPSRRPDSAQLRRAAEEFGFRLDSLHRDMRYLLDSGDYSDASLVFSWEGGGGAAGGAGSGGRSGSDYGFRPKLELPCHRAVLAARSPFFRSVIARRERAGAAGAAGAVGPGGAETRRGGRCAPPGVVRVCVDERVLPRRFARALLHAAYTDQVDLSLISRCSSSPQTSAGAAPATAWGVNGAGGGGGGGGGAGAAGKTPSFRQHSTLDDACELYEIARFLEMPIVVQGCEDAIVEALSGDTLPRVLEWSRAPHASKWVHRQAMRYLRDEFASLASGSAPIQRLPRAALADALASPFLQASETQALRALLRWGERAAQARAEEREPNVVWHTAHSVSRKGARRRDASDAELREVIAPLIPLLRLEHALPHDSDILKEARRRGLVSTPPPQMVEGGSSADAWLGRGPYRPPRLFLPYYEEIKALLEDQLVAEAEVSRVRRARYIHHIPDTLYMVSAERASADGDAAGESESGAGAAPAPHVVRALRARARELRAAPPAARALRHPTADAHQIHRQIALRTVREFSLPDACAELVGAEDADAACERRPSRAHRHHRRSRAGGGGGGGGGEAGRWDVGGSSDDECGEPHCRCPRARVAGEEAEARSRSAGSQRSLRSLPRHEEDWRLEDSEEEERAAGGAGALPALIVEGQPAHTAGAPSRYDEEGGGGGRLSEAVPDVAVCRSRVPNANTHLLSSRDYFRRVFTPVRPELGGGMLQLDLGDGATHTPPRHGSRAHRAAPPSIALARAAPAALVAAPPAAPPAQRSHTHTPHRDLDLQSGMSTLSLPRRERGAGLRAPPSQDELRAAVELSVIQAYSSLLPRSLSPSLGHPLLSAGAGAGAGRHSATLPHYTTHQAPAAAALHSTDSSLHSLASLRSNLPSESGSVSHMSSMDRLSRSDRSLLSSAANLAAAERSVANLAAAAAAERSVANLAAERGGVGNVSAHAGAYGARSASPRRVARDRLREYAHYRPPHDYSPGARSSRGHSPGGYS